MALIELHRVRKTYSSSSGEVRALDGLDLTVEEGTVRGLLGPNGAGKTTTVKILTTLTTPTAGTATVAGLDVVRDATAIRRIIGASGQYATIDEELSARENLLLIGRLFHLGDRIAKQRADELLTLFDLTAAADRPVKGFSGGMRRRADLAASLVSDPKILFLDEPTTGLDPVARMNLWEVIRERVNAGTTLLLTTQYLEEADQLADGISVIDRGTVVAEGTADELKARVGGQSIRVTVQDAVDLDEAVSVLGALPDRGESAPIVSGRTVSVTVTDGVRALEKTAAEVQHRGIGVHDIGLDRPTLDDVFLALTASGEQQGDN